MTIDKGLVEWLADEVWELFQAGGVGLYEFIEILNSDYRPASAAGLSIEGQRSVARAALDRLLGTGANTLRWNVWATKYDEPASVTDIVASSWETPTAAPYLAIEETYSGPPPSEFYA